ncbi:MAG: hypothetical protein EXS35_11015 [Pedosphaera sp.]|nr:hypothetical protein [Pedosphaera sp.]
MAEVAHIAAASGPETTGPSAHRTNPRRRLRSGRGDKFFKLPAWAWGVFLLLAAGGYFTANPVLTAFAILLVPVFIELLWLEGEPPAMLFACGMQWLQGSIAIFYTDWHRLSLDGIFGGPQLARATWLSLIAVFVLAVGMRLMQFGRSSRVGAAIRDESRGLQIPTLFMWYLVAFVVFSFVEAMAARIPALQQALLAAATIRWVLVFLLAAAVLVQRRYYLLLGTLILIEFVTGIMGFFAGFKGVFFVLLVALPLAYQWWKGWRLVQLIAVGMVVMALSVVWSVVKGEYREFLNQGSGQQEVVVPVGQRAEKLAELVGKLDWASLDEGFDTLVIRVSYVKFFAMTLMNVPENVPHERGALWLGAVKHVLTPRILFPNKPALDDSERTVRYTGIQVAGTEQGTSIGIGYVGESYIDFGYVGMFAPIFVLGMFYGWIYRHFVQVQKIRLMGCALATVILIFGAFNLETSNIKLVGGNLMSFIVMGLFAKFAAPAMWTALTVATRRKQPRRPVAAGPVPSDAGDHVR